MKRLIALLILMIAFSTGCSKVGTGTKTGNISKPVLQIQDSRLGDISFKAEESKSVSVEYPADGSEVSLSVADGAGVEWTLTIPGDALPTEKKITITPMTDIKSKTFPGTPTSGILMEPDGLQFITAATISVKKPGGKLKGLILSGDHQGSGLKFSPVSDEEGILTASIMHFSSIVFDPTDDPGIRELQKYAEEQYREAEKAAKEMLEEQIEVPAPPSIPLECLDESKYSIAREYADEVVNPESEVLGPLLSAGRAVCIMGGDTKGAEFELAGKLLQRNMKKVQTLIKTYQPQPEKLLAVYTAAIRVSREASTLQVGDIQDLAAIGRWAAQVRDQCMDKLYTGHNYKMVSAIFECDKVAGIWGMDAPDTIEKVAQAFTFKVSFEGKVTMDDEDGTTTWRTKGEALIKHISTDLGTWFLQGEGTGMHTDYNSTDPVMVETLVTKDFPIIAGLYDINICEEKANIIVDRLGAEKLTYRSDDGQEGTFPSFFNWIEFYLEDNYDKKSSIIKVPIEFESGQGEFEETLEGSYENSELSYTIKMVHSPQ